MSGYDFQKLSYFCLKIFFTLANSVDTDEMPHLGPHGKSTGLGVSRIQWVKVLSIFAAYCEQTV